MEMAQSKHSWGRRLDALLNDRNWSSQDLADRIIERFPSDSVSGKARERIKLKQQIEKYRLGDVGQPRGSLMADMATTFGVSKAWLSDGLDSPSGSQPIEVGKLPVAGTQKPAL